MPTADIFSPYPVTGDQIRAIRGLGSDHLSGIEFLQGFIAEEQRLAVAMAEGDIAPLLGDAVTPIDQTSRQIHQTGLYAFAALDLFALSVDKYNVTSGYPRSITKLNQAYHEGLAAAAVPAPKLAAALRSEHRCLQRNLDDDAVRICRMLDVGPTDRTVRAMFALGALPASDLSTFHGLATPTVDDWKAHISFRAQIQDLPPLHLIPGEHRLAIQSDPGVMTAVGAGLVVGGSLGERDARRLRNRLLDDIAHVEEPRLAWLVTYTRFAEQSPGVRLTDAQLDYLESFYDSTIRRHADPTNPGRRMRILDYVGDDDELRAYFAHGLLALSNERIGGDIARLPDAVHETEVGDFLLY